MKERIFFVTLWFLSVNTNITDASDEILLRSRRLTPAEGMTPATRATIEAIPGRAHVLIQLAHTPTTEERKALEAEGIELLSYIPNKAWFASIPSHRASQIPALPHVRAVSEILPTDKVSPQIREGKFLWCNGSA
jgi:hypothetical protein